MSDSKLESKELWVRIEGRAEFCRSALANATAGSRLNTWDHTIFDLSEAVLELKSQQARLGKLLARQAVKNMEE